jgi:hypothetical protein
MLFKSIISLGVAAPLVIGAMASMAGANIINNGSFVTGPTTPVTPNDWQYGGGATWDNSNPFTGSHDAFLNNTQEANNANVFQQTAFGSVTADTSYTFNYETEFQGGTGAVGQAQFEFLNSTGGVIGNPDFYSLPTTTSGFGTAAGYQLSSQNIIAPTGASAVFVSFNAVTGAVSGSTAQAYIGQVSLTPAATPEPATLGLLGVGSLGLLTVRRRFGRN